MEGIVIYELVGERTDGKPCPEFLGRYEAAFKYYQTLISTQHCASSAGNTVILGVMSSPARFGDPPERLVYLASYSLHSTIAINIS
jgi:hypothetical protein